jgi:hypothetical protein
MNELFENENHFPDQEDNSDTLSNIIIDNFFANDGDQSSEGAFASN